MVKEKIKSKACPYIRFLFIEINSNEVRIGPRVLVSELVEQYHINEALIKSYTVRGVKDRITSGFELKLEEDNLTVHNLFSKQSSDLSYGANFLEI